MRPVRRTMGPGRRVAAVLAALVLVLAACSRGGAGDAAGIRLAVEGVARVLHPGEEVRRVDDDVRLQDGDVVEIVEGRGVITWPDASTVELREGLGEAEHSRVRVAPRPTLEAGAALVSSPAGLTVRAETVTVDVTGAARLSVSLAAELAVYRGAVALESAGRVLEVPALRQAVVPSLGFVPDRPVPLDYDADDPWDRRFLADAIDLGEQLLAHARGFTAQLPAGEGVTAGFYRLVLPELDDVPAFDQTTLDRTLTPPGDGTAGAPLGASSPAGPRRPAGEVLVGASIALAGSEGTFAERWDAVFAFRDAGAHWGLVALDQGVGDVTLVERVELALGRAPQQFASAAPGTATPGAGPALPPAPGGTGGSPGDGDGSGPSQPEPPGGEPPSPPTTQPPSPPTTEPPDDGDEGLIPPTGTIVDDVADPVDDTLSGLLQGESTDGGSSGDGSSGDDSSGDGSSGDGSSGGSDDDGLVDGLLGVVWPRPVPPR